MLSSDPLMHEHTGTAIARFDRYHDAQLAVDRLADADAGVDVTGTEIVASGLHVVEQRHRQPRVVELPRSRRP